MNRNRKILLIVLIYVTIAAAVILFFVIRNLGSSPGTPSADPAKTVEKFIDAYNGDDIYQMIDYITYDKQELIRDVLDAADEYSDGKIKRAMEMMPVASTMSKFAKKDDNLPDLDATVKKVKKNGKKADVDITAAVKNADIISIGFHVNLDYDEKNKVWLIDSAVPDI